MWRTEASRLRASCEEHHGPGCHRVGCLRHGRRRIPVADIVRRGERCVYPPAPGLPVTFGGPRQLEGKRLPVSVEHAMELYPSGNAHQAEGEAMRTLAPVGP